LLSGSDPVEAIEQEDGVPIDNSLRPVNSSHGVFESAPVHTLGLCNVIADPAIVAELSAQGEGTRYGAITRRFALRAIGQSIGFPTSEGVGPGWQMQPLGELACARADEPPSPPTERLSAGRQLNAIFALALLAAPSVRGCPMKADIAIFLA